MAAKGKKGRSDDFKQEEALQAVVIADSFNIRFAPVTSQKPKALLPIVNVPLIDYTLQSLYYSGVQHVILFCNAYASQIKQHIQEKAWSTSRMLVEVIVSESCTCLGDALRDLDAKGVLNHDFILLPCDVVFNIKLKPIFEAHKQRRQKLKNPVATILMKKAPPNHPSRCKEDTNVYAIDGDDGRLVDFHSFENRKKFKLSVELIMKCRELRVRYDFLETHIMICSPQVPALFSDNFDYLTRDDFIRGILNNEEILGNTIYIEDIETSYGAKVSNMAMYDAVSQNIMSRWCYPLVPEDIGHSRGGPKYTLDRHNVYRGSDVEIGGGSKIQNCVIIGHGSTIGSGCVIKHSTIGKRVHIGNNVKLDYAYILDGCVIEDNCSVTRSMIDSGVTLKTNVHIGKGCVIGKRVVVGAGISISSPLCLTAPTPNAQSETALVGSEGYGVSYSLKDYSEDIGDVILPHMQEGWGVEAGSHSSDAEEEEEDEEESESEGEEEGGFSEDEVDAFDEPDVAASMGGVEFEDTKLFYEEVIGTLERGLDEEISTQNLVLEINSAKSAYGIYIDEVNKIVTKAVLALPSRKNSKVEGDAYIKQLLQMLMKLLPLLKNYIKSAESQLQCLQAIEEFATHSESLLTGLQNVLKMLYDTDILEEENIIKWYNGSQVTTVKSKVSRFIEWLQEAEEESDSD